MEFANTNLFLEDLREQLEKFGKYHAVSPAELFANRTIRTVFPPPSSIKAKINVEEEVRSAYSELPRGRTVYVHIPFVQRALVYHGSSYQLESGQSSETVDDYMKLLHSELRMGRYSREQPPSVESIYIGGGTPTIIPPHHLDELLYQISSCYTLTDGGELTLQSTPETLTEDVLLIAKQHGVNRITLAIESFDPKYLDHIGAPFRKSDILKCIERARTAGIERIHLDLVKENPKYSGHTRSEDIRGITLSKPNSFTRYPKKKSYSITPGNLWHGNLNPEMLNSLSDQYLFAANAKELGYEYSCSASDWFWLNPEDQFMQQQQKWRDLYDLESYGLGAHGYIQGTTTVNYDDLKTYLNVLSEGKRPLKTECKLTDSEQIARHLALGLRLGLPSSSLDPACKNKQTRRIFGSVKSALSELHIVSDITTQTCDDLRLSYDALLIYPWIQSRIWQSFKDKIF